MKLEESFDFEAAEKLAGEALAVNPQHAGAYAVRAGIALRDMDLGAANAAIDAGLAIDPNDLELLSLRAAARFLADDKPGFEAAKREVFARNKEFSQAYAIIGDYAEWEHRYEDVVAMMKEAVALDPKDSKAWAQLGLTQTRAGDEAEGVKSLEAAWKGDHFNVRVYNTLEMLYTRWIPQQYEGAQESIFNIRYPKDEKAILERYVPRMLGEAWGAMKMHYMFAPAGARRRRDVLRPRALQRAHERAPERRHRGGLLRPRRRGHEPEERAVQLGQRSLARARARVRDPALEVPRAALVHRGPVRVRDDDPPARMAARARSRSSTSPSSAGSSPERSP